MGDRKKEKENYKRVDLNNFEVRLVIWLLPKGLFMRYAEGWLTLRLARLVSLSSAAGSLGAEATAAAMVSGGGGGGGRRGAHPLAKLLPRLPPPINLDSARLRAALFTRIKCS